MPSPITQNIATAVSNTLPTQPTVNPNQAQNLNPQQIAIASQRQAKETSYKARVDDKARSPRVPKTTEAGYAPQAIKQKAGRNSTEENKEPQNSPTDELDVVA